MKPAHFGGSLLLA